MTRALLITPEIKDGINAAIARARAKPIPWETLKPHAIGPANNPKNLALADRNADWRPLSEHVVIPHGYMAAISFEMQPAGLIRHLSVSVDTVGKLPHPVAVEELASLFGFRLPLLRDLVWLEEFDPGHHAVNVVQLETDVPEPAAKQ